MSKQHKNTRKILGLDIGTSSIGWALVEEDNGGVEQSYVEKLGVRVLPLSPNEKGNFDSGKSFSLTQERTAARGARRNLQRYKLRRDALKNILFKAGILSKESILTESGKGSTHELWRLRSKSASEKLTLEEFGRVLLAINKKRGYKSNRKAKDKDDGEAINGMKIAIEIHEKNLTPGQYVANILSYNNSHIPEFYPSDLQSEFDRVWERQASFYPDLLSSSLKQELHDKSGKATWVILKPVFNLQGVALKDSEGKKIKGFEEKKEKYKLRAAALDERLDPEYLAIVFQEINGQKSNTSGYLGKISDRSKALHFNKQTIGQWGYQRLQASFHNRLKEQVFYRQDYLNEFKRIWEIQSSFYPEVLTEVLKSEIRDIAIFYQRPLKSQKSLIASCELESVLSLVNDPRTKKPLLTKEGEPKKRLLGPKVISRSNPLFQEFKIWQSLNNLEVRHKTKRVVHKISELDPDMELRKALAEELNWTSKLSSTQVLKFIVDKPREWELNYRDGIQGNITQALYLEKFLSILEARGHTINLKNGKGSAIPQVEQLFKKLGFNHEVFHFNSKLEQQEIEQQASWMFWHLLYSYQGDQSISGDEALYRKLYKKFNFDKEAAKILSTINFIEDYGSLSARAIRKILPFLKEGNTYSEAAELAGYRHSKWETAEEQANRQLKGELEILPKNSLRNPVVEKILNQTFHVVNGVIEKYGKPDEVRIELARDLKKSAKERAEATSGIAKATKQHEDYKKEIAQLPQFAGGVRITRNDIIKYKLWLELQSNGFKTLYSNTYIAKEELFSRRFDIEHIIPKALVFDDSFSNKTLELREVNQRKSNTTAYDFLEASPMEGLLSLEEYESQVEILERNGSMSKAKKNKLLKKASDIGDGFIERDLRNTQYIAKKAQELLREVIRTVTPTTGSITDRLREDWGLTNLMREMNFPIYEKLDLTHVETKKDGQSIKVISDWSKRNDQRHHAMDALTIAFTKPAFVQYINYLHARRNESHKMHGNIIAIERQYTYFDEKQKRLMKPPMPLEILRREFKTQLEQVLVSYKAKNTVVTKNINRAKKKGGGRQLQITKTPRGQLHKETVYKKTYQQDIREEKVNAKFDHAKVDSVCSPSYRQALRQRLAEFGGDPKRAFTGKNTLAKNPLPYEPSGENPMPEKVKVMVLEQAFTIRKPITHELKIDKVTDERIKKILTKRLKEYGGVSKKAFENLEKNPIWQNEEKGIAIKSVTIKGVNIATPLHTKYDHYGKPILDVEGETVPNSYVQTGNNHHVAIYRDDKGELQEQIVSLFEAVERVNVGSPIIDHSYHQELGWELLFTLKENEIFIFPNAETGFDPHEIDLRDPQHLSEISKNLYRVQKISTKNYEFRHHLETVAQRKNKNVNEKPLRDIIWKRYQSMGAFLESLPVKVRMNHLGEIVSVGEY